MLRRTALSLIASLLIATGLYAGPATALDRFLTEEEQALIRDISLHNSTITTMAGRFLQIDTRGNRTEGTFFLERPNKIRFRYAPPSRDEIVSAGRGFYVINRKDQTQYAYPQEQVPLRQFLTDEIDLLTANLVDVVSSETYMSITIADETPIGQVQVSLIFDVETLNLAQWTLVEPSGAELTFSLYDVLYDVEIPKSFFYINPTWKHPSEVQR